MGRRLPSLSALRAFEAAGRQLSFSKAAQELFVTQSAVSRHIRTLELDLKVTLFRRMNRRVELTAEGAQYLATLSDCFSQIEAATLAIQRRKFRDVLAVNVLPTLAIQWLIPRLVSFSEENSGVEVHLTMSAAPVDFGHDTVDAAIRVGTLPGHREGTGVGQSMTTDWRGIQTDHLLHDALSLVCSPALLDGGPPLRTASQMSRHVLLHTATRRHAWPEWLRSVGLPEPTPKAEQWFGHFFMTHQAARDGHGIAVLPTFLVLDDLRAGRLVAPFGHAAGSPASYYLLYRAQQAGAPKLRLFREWLKQQAELIEQETKGA
jgi:LysR family transcriptional regulator, glycine cleavage system transcriptional activator